MRYKNARRLINSSQLIFLITRPLLDCLLQLFARDSAWSVDYFVTLFYFYTKIEKYENEKSFIALVSLDKNS